MLPILRKYKKQKSHRLKSILKILIVFGNVKASGLSSNTDDYFDADDAVLVESK